MTSRIHRLFDAVSQFLNVLFWNGEANHSISGDAYRYNRKRTKAVIDYVFYVVFNEAEHCLGSYLADVQRAKDLIDEHRRNHV